MNEIRELNQNEIDDVSGGLPIPPVPPVPPLVIGVGVVVGAIFLIGFIGGLLEDPCEQQ